MISHEYKHRVIYADTDAMGVMYYANYLKVYEAARGDFMRKIGFSFSEAEEKGIICPAINVNVQYKRFAKFDWVVTVVSSVRELPLVKLEFIQEMFDPDGNLVNKAVITLGFVNAETQRVGRCPEWILNFFKEKLK